VPFTGYAVGFLLSETQTTGETYMSSTPPTSVIRDGSLKATIWENNGEKGTYFTTTFAKTYRDQNGDLKDTNVFTNNDLLKVSELAREARSKTRELQQDRSYNRSQERTPERTPEQSPHRTQEGSPNRSPEQADSRKARAEAFLSERREDRSLEHDHGMER